MKKTSIKISLVINILIFITTIIASIIMFTGFKFMYGYETVLESTKIGMFRFFTVDSNLFMGITALVFATAEIKLLKGKTNEISLKLYILKLMATTGVGLTFLIVFGYLGQIADGGIPSMIMNSNLFFHLLIPVISMINFAIFERTDKIKFRYAILGITPAALYAIYYLINVLIHIEDGRVSPLYDWYWFVQGGLWQIVIVMPLILGITYIISLTLWGINKKRTNS